MSRHPISRGQRRTPLDKPVLVATPAPTPTPGAPTVPAEVVPADAPTTPAVPSTKPLPSDQASAAPVPIAPIAADLAPFTPADRPPVAPAVVPAAALVPPAAAVTTSDVVMEHVPSTVPLPSDQVTPYALAPAGSFVDAIHRELGALSPEERAMVRDRLFGDAAAMRAATGGDGIRLFPVAYEVDHDGRLYRPGGGLVALTYEEHARLFRATAIAVAWDAGETPTS